MGEDSHNLEIFGNIMKNLADINESEMTRRNKAYIYRSNIQKEVPEVIKEIKAPYAIKKLKRQMQKMEDRTKRIDEFKQQLKGIADEEIEEKFEIENYQKDWLKLTNNQRSNRIVEYTNRIFPEIKNEDGHISRTVSDHERSGKLRMLLIQGITNKLLERKSIVYDKINAIILEIPCAQYNFGTKNYYFI
jgi:glutamyl/glutaminyl-tRNA synthetase